MSFYLVLWYHTIGDPLASITQLLAFAFYILVPLYPLYLKILFGYSGDILGKIITKCPWSTSTSTHHFFNLYDKYESQ